MNPSSQKTAPKLTRFLNFQSEAVMETKVAYFCAIKLVFLSKKNWRGGGHSFVIFGVECIYDKVKNNVGMLIK